MMLVIAITSEKCKQYERNKVICRQAHDRCLEHADSTRLCHCHFELLLVHSWNTTMKHFVYHDATITLIAFIINVDVYFSKFENMINKNCLMHVLQCKRFAYNIS